MLLNIEILTRTGDIKQLKYDTSKATVTQLRTAFEKEIRNRELIGDYFKDLPSVSPTTNKVKIEQSLLKSQGSQASKTIEESKKEEIPMKKSGK